MIGVRIHQHGTPDVLKVESLPERQISPTEICVSMKASALNHLDIWVRKGFPGVPLPLIPGSDGAGVVEKVGDEVSGFSRGDEVMIQPLIYCGRCTSCQNGNENLCTSFGILGESQDGTFTSQMVVDENNLIRKPSHLTFNEAAGFSLVAQTSYEMLIHRAKIKSGEIVLVWGASSGVGSMAVQIAKSVGCHVIAVSSSMDKCTKIKSLGADDCVNHKLDPIYDSVMDLTEGNGVDVVFEHVGAATWDTSMKLLKNGGRVVTCGATTGPKANINLTHVFYKQLSILGNTMGSKKSINEVTQLLNERKIKPIVDSVYPLAEIQKAHSYLEAGKQFGKVIIEMPHE